MSEHIICGGELVFSHKEKAGKVLKSMHKCSKCGALINVITMPSYEQYVMMGAIRVSNLEYQSIRDHYARLRE